MGQFLEGIARFQAARNGTLAQYDYARQMGQSQQLAQAGARADLLQAPEVRANPEVLKMLGVNGAPTQGAASSLTAGPNRMQQFVTNVAQGRPVSGQPADLPRMVDTDASATRILKGAQASQLNAQANRLLAMSQGNGAGAPEGFIELGRTVDPITGGTKINYGPPKAKTYPVGTIGSNNQPLKSGKDPETGEVIRLGVPAGQGAAAAAVKAQAARLDSSIASFEGLDTPTTFPDGRKVTIWDAMGQAAVPGINKGGVLGTITEFGRRTIPGVETAASSYLASWANDEALPPEERKARQDVIARIDTVQGLVANAVKALGDAGALAEGEQKLLRQAFLPTPGEDPGLSRAKVQRALEIQKQIRDSLRSGATKNDVRAIIAAQAKVELGPIADGDTPAVMPEEATPAAAATGRTTFDPAALDEAEKLFQ